MWRFGKINSHIFMCTVYVDNIKYYNIINCMNLIFKIKAIRKNRGRTLPKYVKIMNVHLYL